MKIAVLITFFVVVLNVSGTLSRANFASNAHDMILDANERARRQVDEDDENIDDRINKINQEHHLDLLEGDILTMPEDYRMKRSGAVTQAFRKWSTVVPYVFDQSLSDKGRDAVRAALADLEQKTCLRFKPKTNEEYYLRYFKGGGCYSYIGKVKANGQEISIGYGCENKGTVIHETMHALGFYHEQSRSDRDNHVKIHYENILPGKENNFAKSNTINEGDYDYNSVMHYSRRAFTSNGKPTVTAIDDQGLEDPDKSLGQRDGASDLDIKGINKLYCGATGGGTGTSGNWSGWSRCSNSCRQTRTRDVSNGQETETQSCTGGDCDWGGNDCKDKMPNKCPIWIIHCEEKKYSKFLEENCQKTCEFCSEKSSD